ncbi:MAG: hypothetical protein ACFBWO_07275 [Paracoccaceae bacterium]
MIPRLRLRLRRDAEAARRHRRARRHPLYLGARLGLAVAALAGLWFGLPQAAVTLERMRTANATDDLAFRDTLVAETVAAAAGMDAGARLTAALDAGDYQLAEALHAAARLAGTSLAPEIEARYEAATSPLARSLRAGRDAVGGALTGECASVACLAGALGADLAVPLAADLRDVVWQGGRLATGTGGDEAILGLAAIGLAIPLVQPMTDPLKAALRFTRRSGALAADLRRLVARAVDLPGLKRWARSGGALADPGAAARFLRRAELSRLTRAGDDLIATARHGGLGAAALALRHADGAADLRHYRRAARVMGDDAAAAAAVLGRRLPKLAKAWRLSRPLVAELVAIGALMAGAVQALVIALASGIGEGLARRGTLAGLAGWLARR